MKKRKEKQMTLEIDPDWLRQKYVAERLTIDQVSRLCHHTHEVVAANLRRLGILRDSTQTRSLRATKPLYRNPAWLIHQHRLLGLSLTEMAAIADVKQPTISAAMARYNIPVLYWPQREKLREEAQAQACRPTCPGWMNCLDITDDKPGWDTCTLTLKGHNHPHQTQKPNAHAPGRPLSCTP